MDFELTEEQRMIQEMARNFAEKEVAPVAAELDETHRFPTELARKMGELGLMGIAVPEEYGGAGMDYVSYVVALEEISRACANTGVIMSANNSLACAPVLANGTEEQKKRFLAPMAAGEKIGCFGLTEPSAGSDAANQKTTAVLDGDNWVLNGNKVFITNGTHADIAVIFAMTDKEKGSKGISTFVVEKGTPGFSAGQAEKKLGLNASGTAELVFEDCRIPENQLLGQRGQGFKIALQTLDGGRIGIAAQAVGIARAAMEQSARYALEREQFNQPIAKFQAIQWMLADMATEIDAARLLAYRAARLQDSGQRYTKEAAMAKLFASETAMKTATKAVQIHGGYGYSKEYPVERYFRDAKITEIYEGTSEIQRLVIAANVLR
ncbi:MAG: acyl-CoA dehydrogenase [Candidatus Hydrogenedentota bacterium]|nr:MAG: acyl-CoA dehydrogenase [Candidatus Hydrogenedentota bacterium]